MRKQYHFRRIDGHVQIWDVDGLVRASSGLAVQRIAISDIAELDEPYWFEATDTLPTCRRVIEHAQLIQDADLSHPIILSADGRVMDGMHRVAKALQLGRTDIEAHRFDVDPPPDFIDRHPSELLSPE